FDLAGEIAISPAASDCDEVAAVRIEETEDPTRRRLAWREVADHLQADHSPDVPPCQGPGVDGAPHLGRAEVRRLLVGEGHEIHATVQATAGEKAGDLDQPRRAAGVVVRPRIGPEAAER